MGCNTMTRELWRLRVNWFITLLLSPVLFCVSYIGVLTSFHRFLTDPRLNETQQQNSTVEGGLGESELFYSLVIAAQHIGSVIGSLSNGILVKYISYTILFTTATSLHVVGYVLYGLATHGWMVMVGELLSGYFLGAQGTLSYAYVTDSTSTYVKLMRKKEGLSGTDEKREISVRNVLFALKTLGNSLGSLVGSGTAILLTFLPVDQYRAIAWVNVGAGSFLLLTLILLFRGELNCTKIHKCKQVCKCSKGQRSTGPLQIFILITMYVLVFVDVVKWGFFETLMNPILSDSFGFTLRESSFFYLGFSVARVGGAVFVTVLQRFKVKPQIIGIVAITTVVSGYFIIADWQAIPYDPCTECSPYHHPELLTNLSACINATGSETFDDFMDFDELVAFDTLQSNTPIRKLRMMETVDLLQYDQEHAHRVTGYSYPLSVSFQDNKDYSLASNACMSADFPHRQCHWIPFSLIGKKECEDCPPICRSIRQTLSFPQFILGMALLVATNPLIWFPMIAVVSNQTPPENQGLAIGFFFTTSTAAQSICPIFLDAIYEGFQKRTFVAAIVFGTLHIPFLLEFIFLFKKLGPRYSDKEHKYTQLLINAEAEEDSDSDSE